MKSKKKMNGAKKGSKKWKCESNESTIKTATKRARTGKGFKRTFFLGAAVGFLRVTIVFLAILGAATTAFVSRACAKNERKEKKNRK